MKPLLNKLKFKYKIIIIILLTSLGAALNAIGVKYFMRPLHLVPLGATGSAFAVEQIALKLFNINIPYYYVYFVINIAVETWAFFKLSKSLVLTSILYVVIFTITSWIIPQIQITDDKFVNVVSGGMLNAIGNVLVLMVGGTAAGYTVIGLHLGKKLKKPMVGVVNTIGDILNMSILVFIFGVEVVILSLIASAINSIVIDKYHNQSNFVTLNIVTKNPNLFTSYANSKLKRTTTILKSTGSYTYEDNYTVVMTLSKYKFSSVKKDLSLIDPNAHITIYNVQQIIGNMKSTIGKSIF